MKTLDFASLTRRGAIGFGNVFLSIALLVTGGLAVPARAANPLAGSGTPAESTGPAAPSEVPATALIQPEALAKILKSGQAPKPVVIQVGFHVLYVQAHIPGSEFIGPASSAEALRKLGQHVAALPHTQLIVLYCGCCPWVRCPNVLPAYAALQQAGFTNVKVLYIAHNFGTDWVDHGYPVAKGD